MKERTPCQVYTRVMGYLRPVNFYNKGKKSEFYNRKTFNVDKSMESLEEIKENNRSFMEKFGKKTCN